MDDGTVGVLACAGASDCEKDKAVAVNTLQAHGYTLKSVGVVLQGHPSILRVFSKGGQGAAPEDVTVER